MRHGVAARRTKRLYGCDVTRGVALCDARTAHRQDHAGRRARARSCAARLRTSVAPRPRRASACAVPPAARAHRAPASRDGRIYVAAVVALRMSEGVGAFGRRSVTPWVALLLRVAISPQFVYACRESVNAANIVFDVFLYITLASVSLMWWLRWRTANGAPQVYSKDKAKCDTIVLLVIVILAHVCALVFLVPRVSGMKWHRVSLSSCYECPGSLHNSRKPPCNEDDNYWYNELNYCSASFAAQCVNTTDAVGGPDDIFALLRADASAITSLRCVVLGCSARYLPLQYVASGLSSRPCFSTPSWSSLYAFGKRAKPRVAPVSTTMPDTTAVRWWLLRQGRI